MTPWLVEPGTAWSCAHGVGRWYKNCGCQTGGQPGWNQEWRGPLRKAFDLIRDECARRFEEIGTGLFRDPWAARDDYIDVIVSRGTARETFLAHHVGHPLDNAERVRALTLLEMQRNAVIALQSMAMSAQAGRPVPASAGTGSAPDAAATAASDSGAGVQPLPFNPAQWWNALHEQFARVASAAATEAERAAADPQPAREAEAPPPRGPAEAAPATKAGRKPSAG